MNVEETSVEVGIESLRDLYADEPSTSINSINNNNAAEEGFEEDVYHDGKPLEMAVDKLKTPPKRKKYVVLLIVMCALGGAVALAVLGIQKNMDQGGSQAIEGSNNNDGNDINGTGAPTLAPSVNFPFTMQERTAETCEGGFRTCTEVEECALQQLFVALNGCEWYDRTNWLSFQPICDWHGVTCSSVEEDGEERVTELDWRENNLRGSLPNALLSVITHLKELEYLDLDDNSLTGTIPSELALLTSLGLLSFSQNLLTGSLPTELATLSSLFYFASRTNQHDGVLPQEYSQWAPRLESLELKDNLLLQGSLFDNLGDFQQLLSLDLEGTDIGGTISTSIGNLKQLWYVALDRTNVRGPIPTQVGTMESLEYFSVYDAYLTGTIPSQLGNCAKLETLDLSYNDKLGGPVPTELGQLQGLAYFDLEANYFNSTLFISSVFLKKVDNSSSVWTSTSWPWPPNLTFFSVQNNNITGPLPSSLGALNFLQWLHLDKNEFEGTMPAALCERVRTNFLQLDADCESPLLNCSCFSSCCPAQI
uniref:Leucine-rich repeat-containing N-terminal plant-type domain-containing protein n=1 Tax=Attheya septentrionalis TaxID=420275 RepID=A0A7S2UPH9_9STRA|mmetsp:Transcript_4845/g.8507  ORF Transcript_4845/g.8507 Transcript_4845/m.8507 type:complete len:536 (+) Transcript_4845:176-1783(+)